MMKYRNSEYNRQRNEMMCNVGLLAVALGVGALGHVLVSTNSVAVALVCVVVVLGALGLSSLRNIRA